MGRRMVEAGTLLATLLSALLLVVLLTAPIQPQGPSVAPLPSPTQSPSAAPPAPGTALQPMGVFLMRTPFSLGPCLAVELSPASYPVAEGAEGTATVSWWHRGMTGCDGRSGDVQTLEARTHVVPDDDDPDAPPVGYTVEFSTRVFDQFGPVASAPAIRASLTILARQSSDSVLQAVEDAPASGQGYVLDRVPAVDPPLDPLTTATPGPSASPAG